MNIKLPNNLIQSIQNDYITSNYKDGVFTFQGIDINTIETIIHSFLTWAKENDHLNDSNSLDVSSILGKDL